MTDIAKLYETALRKKYRFQAPKSPNGLTVEQLWEVPLKSRDDFNLNTVAKTVNKALKEIKEEDFVSDRRHPNQNEFEQKLELVKHVIGVKQDEEAKAKKRKERKERETKLLEALAKKQDSVIDGMSEEDIKKELASIYDDED